MVKIKVQSAEDIIKAYLLRLGFDNNVDVTLLKENYPHLSSSPNVVTEMDNIIYRLSQNLYATRLPKQQTIALYKSIFIYNNIAQRYGIRTLFTDFDNLEYIKEMKSSNFKVAPLYKITSMPTQEITPIHLHKKSSS